MDTSNCIQGLHLQQTLWQQFEIYMMPLDSYHRKKKTKSRETDPTFKSPFIPGTHKLICSLSFLQGIMAKRKAYLHKNGLDRTDGSIYSKTLEGFAQRWPH